MRILGVLGAVLALLIVGVVAAGWYVLRASGARNREEYAASLAKVRDDFLADQELARTYPVLAPAQWEHDAGPFLNPRVGWYGDPTRLARWRERFAGPIRPVTLDQALVDRIPCDWMKSPPSLWHELDFSWMADLGRFDHWDVEAASPWADEPHATWPGGFPLLHELVPWAKLRLAKALATGDFATGAAETEHLGALLLSTETMLGTAEGLHVLALVREGARAAGMGRELEAHVGIDQVTRLRAHRATMAAHSFLRGEAPESFRRDADRILVGRCAALNEALRGALAMREAVGAGVGEPIHWVRLDGDFAKACRLSLVRRAIAQGRVGDVERNGGSCGSADSAVRLLCQVLVAIPGGRALERTVNKEVLTQIMLANLHPDAWYATGRGASSR